MYYTSYIKYIQWLIQNTIKYNLFLNYITVLLLNVLITHLIYNIYNYNYIENIAKLTLKYQLTRLTHYKL